jgi:hypothetical protein
MRPIPPAVQARFIAHLKRRTVPSNTYSLYLKWLRCYLDFCEKYHFPGVRGISLAQFLLIIHKLQGKKHSSGRDNGHFHKDRSVL